MAIAISPQVGGAKLRVKRKSQWYQRGVFYFMIHKLFTTPKSEMLAWTHNVAQQKVVVL